MTAITTYISNDAMLRMYIVLLATFTACLSELMVHDLHQVRDLLVLCCLDKPFPEVPLDRHMEHFLLLACQPSRLNLLLDFEELGVSQLHHLRELLRAQEKWRVTKLLWK